MKKELLIAAKFDTSDFDKSVERMQNRLKDLYAPADMVRMQTQTASRMNQMGIGGMGVPGSEAFQRETMKSRRELDSFIKEQAQGQEKLTKIISARAEKLEKLKKDQAELVRGSKEELEIKEKIARVEENNFRLREYYKQRDATLGQALDSRNKVAPRDIPGLIDAFRQGGFRYGMSQIPGAFRQNPWGMGGTTAALAGGGLNIGANMLRDYFQTPMRTDQAFGNAVQGTAGRDVNNIYARRTAFEQNFQPERQRAAQLAIQNMEASRIADKMTMAGSILMIGGGAAMAKAGAGTGGAIGAAVGSIIPGLGNAGLGTAGALVGALPGLGVAGKGLHNILGSERQRSMLLGTVSSQYGSRYQSILAEQMAKDYEGSIEAQKRQNPFKTAAVGDYEQNFMGNLQAQRQLGLGNEGFYGAGGFLRRGIGAGFTPEMGLEMSQNILGAGGSTRMARDSVFGNQMQRGLGMTNAGQILGSLSGGMGGSEATQQATIKILAEGMRIGLDDSKFAEENRRFTQSVAEIVSKSGAMSAADAERIAGGFGSFVGENTNRGIDAARTAFEQYQQISQTTTGPRGVMRAAGFMRDEKLSQLDTIEKQALMQVPENELNDSNILVRGAAQKLGISTDDLVGRIRGVNQGSVSRFKEADQLRDRVRGRLKDLGVSQVTQENIGTLPQDVQQDLYKLASFQTTELGNQGSRETFSRLTGTVGAERTPADIQRDREAVLKGKIEGPSGRMEDNTVAAMAGDASTVLKNFNEMRGGMDAAAKSAASFTDAIRELNVQLQQALEDARTGKGSKGVSEVLQKIMTAPNSSNQSQGGKPRQ